MRPKRHDVIHAILERAKDAKDGGINPTAWIQKVFGLSRQQTTRYLAELCAKGLLQRQGNGPGVRYLYTADRKILLERSWAIEEIKSRGPATLADVNRLIGSKNLPDRALDFIQLTLATLLNNALDHSEADHLRLDLSLADETLILRFADDGVGLFQHIAETFQSPTLVEAVGDFVRGIRRHAPEPKPDLGSILWAADFVRVEANGWQLNIVCRSHDWSLAHVGKAHAGTVFTVEIDPSLPRPIQPSPLRKVLIPIWLFSRVLKGRVADQRDAKRMLRGSWEQEEIILDFNRVDELTHSFMHEIFVRFKSQHPRCGLLPVNMNAGIRSMLMLVQGNKKPRSPKTRKGST